MGGDGISDGNELIAGTNPNSATDVLKIRDVHLNSNGPGGSTQVVLSWQAKTNRVYAVYYLDRELAPGVGFGPLVTNLTTPTNGIMQAIDSSPGAAKRFYRLTVRSP